MNKFTLSLIFAFLLTACNSKPKKPIIISVNHAQNVVEVNGIPATDVYALKNDTLNLEAWQTLFPVFKMPADTELRNLQSPMSGKYRILNNALTFSPDTAFAKDSTYFVRYYRFGDGMNSANIITDKRKPGESPYTELIFKY